MATSLKRAYLLKNATLVVNFVPPTVQQLYSAKISNFKCFPNMTYDDNHIAAVSEAIVEAEKETSTDKRIFVEFHPTYDNFYEKARILTRVVLTEDFVKKLSDVLDEPKIAVEGSYQFLKKVKKRNPCDDLVLDPIQYEFTVADVSLKIGDFKYDNFCGASRMSELHRTADNSAVRFNYSIFLEWKDFSIETQTKQVNMLEKLFNEKPLADCVIVPATGEEIKCHRAVLAIHSDVIHSMLTSGLTESQSNRIELGDVSKEGVENLLKFVYGCNINLNELTEEVSIELLRTAHKYNISNLESIMLRFLCQKPGSWYSINGAITAYFFAVNVNHFQNLCEKMMAILRRNPKQLRTTSAYKDLLMRNPTAAADFTLILLELEEHKEAEKSSTSTSDEINEN